MYAALLALVFYLVGDLPLYTLVKNSPLFDHSLFTPLNHFISVKTQGIFWTLAYLTSKTPHNRKKALQVILALSVMIIVTYALKIAIGRPRPFLFPDATLNPLTFSNSYHSCPSSHSATIFITMFGLTQLYPRLRHPILFIALLLSTARVFTGHHYPSDIALGYLVAQCIYNSPHLAKIPLPSFLRRDFPRPTP